MRNSLQLSLSRFYPKNLRFFTFFISISFISVTFLTFRSRCSRDEYLHHVANNVLRPLNCSRNFLHSAPNPKKSVIPKSFLKVNMNPHSPPLCGKHNLLKPWFYSSKTKYDMLFLVKEAPKYFIRRQLIRSGYGKIKSLKGMKFATIFVVARPQSVEKQKLLEEENAIYGDMVQCEFYDSYKGLPVKVLSTFGWILEDHIQSTFYTMIDDDCIADLANIFTFFTSYRDPNVMYCGFIYDHRNVPYRDPASDCYISPEMYSGKFYPPFCHGGMYTLQRNLVHDLYCMSHLTERGNFFLEDVYITGILREKLGQNFNIAPVLDDQQKPFTIMKSLFQVPLPKIKENLIETWQNFSEKLPWKEYEEANDKESVMSFYERNLESELEKNFFKRYEILYDPFYDSQT